MFYINSECNLAALLLRMSVGHFIFMSIWSWKNIKAQKSQKFLNYLRIILDSKSKDFESIESERKPKYYHRKKCVKAEFQFRVI